MEQAYMQEQYLKMAIQTVLFNYKRHWENVTSEKGNHRILDQMAWEIASLAKHLEKVTHDTVKGMEQDVALSSDCNGN